MLFNYMYQKLDNIQIHTTGCELCVSDARKFAATLSKTENTIVFNTCSFLAEREYENHLLLNLLYYIYPEYKIYVLGCDINNNKDKYSTFTNLYTNEEIHNCIQDIKEEQIESEDPSLCLKIQDGCRHNCSFCIINQLRNNPYSISYKQLKKTIENSVFTHLKLVGTELTTYYDKETGYKLPELLLKIIKDFPQIKQISLGSLDPASTIIEKIIEIVATYRNVFIQHLNLSVQSGNNYILKQMKRRHTVERIRYLHLFANKFNVSLGWDIIVGFPGETDEMYNDTLKLVKELKPLTQSIFKYSPRKGTSAFEMSNQIPEEIKIKRYDILKQLIFDHIEQISKKNNKCIAYNQYIAENEKKQSLNINKHTLFMLLENNAEHVELDVFNMLDFSKVIFKSTETKNFIINTYYDKNRDLEFKIYINFLKEFLKGIPVVVYVKNIKDIIDIKAFESTYNCVVCKSK